MQYAYDGSSGMLGPQAPQLTPLSNLPTRPYESDSAGPSQTLPPLNSQHASYPSTLFRPGLNGPHTPHSAGAPTSQAPPTATSLSHISPQTPLTAGPPSGSHGNSLPAFTPAHAPPDYAVSRAPDAKLPTPGPSYNQVTLPHLTPALWGESDPSHPLPPHNGQPHLPSQGQELREADHRPVPVVGSQGRRGVLPSASGRTPPVGSGLDGSARAGAAPAKNAEGKFPCAYCSKTYLHLKHLKRHHLRHTGERPYQCYLCQETFCRSDILKRHFSKCSVRRGNPTGAGHLTYAQAHLAQPQSAPGAGPPQHDGAGSNGHPGPSVALNSQQWHHGPPTYPQYNPDAPPELSNGRPYDAARSSTSSSISDERKRFSNASGYPPMSTAAETTPTNTTSFESKYHTLPAFRDSGSSSIYNLTSGPAVTSAPPAEHHSELSYGRAYPSYQSQPHGHVHAGDWSSYFQPGAQDNLMFSSS